MRENKALHKDKEANDFLMAIESYDLWIFLAWQDVKLRYKRSKIGQFWITLSMALFCLSLGVVYTKLFKIGISEYLPNLSISFVIWGLISALLGEFPNLYVDNGAYIKDIRINPLTILFRVVARNLIVFAHNALIILGIYVYFGCWPGLVAFFAIPGLALVVLNILMIGISLSIIGARFRDVASINQSLIQILFFISPITWIPRLVPVDSWILIFNPIAYYLDLIKSPLLGTAPSALSWNVSLGTLVFFSLFAAIIYRNKKHRIPFWI